MDADPFKTVELSPNSPAANGHVPYNEDIDKLKAIILILLGSVFEMILQPKFMLQESSVLVLLLCLTSRRFNV